MEVPWLFAERWSRHGGVSIYRSMSSASTTPGGQASARWHAGGLFVALSTTWATDQECLHRNHLPSISVMIKNYQDLSIKCLSVNRRNQLYSICFHLFCHATLRGLGVSKKPSFFSQALRMVAHLIYLTALQTRALLECFLDRITSILFSDADGFRYY